MIKEYSKSNIIASPLFLYSRSLQNRMAGAIRNFFRAMIIDTNEMMATGLSIISYGALFLNELELVLFQQSNEFAEFHWANSVLII